MYDVRDIANTVLDCADELSVPITNLSLQKLLYFVHGWFFSIYNRPLIKNKFEAWQYGPVQRVIYDQFKFSKDQKITGVRATFINPLTGENEYRVPKIDPEHRIMITAILEKYSHYSASALVNESHVEDGPWEYVWQQAEESVYPGMKIPDTLIEDHFRRLKPLLTVH
ncbi:MAG: DUF4065 domain-containing protein [Blastomonas fulva]|uniref:Panacea domain-containing protein n=1 Tax=Blastomonas fulva TaxID=1550728 RepID=UPI0024E1D12A|nr:type II toxin-antitoxin system antitoxin SocA domain-containing protein [Blastomonas fulva]MDK2757934.1 DUF4065 domain-containing protein [Blastomonas fulva]